MRSLFTIIFTLSLLPLNQAQADMRFDMIKLVSGEASLFRSGDSQPAILGNLLFSSDTLTTEGDGAVGILFDDDSRMAIGPNSELELDTYQFDRINTLGSADFKLNVGTLAVIERKLTKADPSAVKIHTPTAILEGRGTAMLLKCSAGLNRGIFQCRT